MMATTELHQVPVTIQSRSQVFELKTLPFASIREQLKSVTRGEQVKIDDAALALVARSAEGSMRDALSAPTGAGVLRPTPSRLHVSTARITGRDMVRDCEIMRARTPRRVRPGRDRQSRADRSLIVCCELARSCAI
jgi:hypothetical protein